MAFLSEMCIIHSLDLNSNNSQEIWVREFKVFTLSICLALIVRDIHDTPRSACGWLSTGDKIDFIKHLNFVYEDLINIQKQEQNFPETLINDIYDYLPKDPNSFFQTHLEDFVLLHGDINCRHVFGEWIEDNTRKYWRLNGVIDFDDAGVCLLSIHHINQVTSMA